MHATYVFMRLIDKQRAVAADGEITPALASRPYQDRYCIHKNNTFFFYQQSLIVVFIKSRQVKVTIGDSGLAA